VPPPVGVRSLDPRAAHAPADLVDRLGAPQVENEEALRMRLGCGVAPAGGDLEVRVRAGEPEEDAVEPLGVPSEPDLELRRKRRRSAAIVGAAGGRSSMVEP
jgi:hypothetical protein